MALADTNYRFVYGDIVVTDKTVILPFLNDLVCGFHAGISSFRNRRSQRWGWGIGAKQKYTSTFGGLNLSVKKKVLKVSLVQST